MIDIEIGRLQAEECYWVNDLTVTKKMSLGDISMSHISYSTNCLNG